LRVVDLERPARLQDHSRDSQVGTKTHRRKAPRYLGIKIGNVGKIEFVVVAIQRQDGRALGIEHVAAFLDDEGQQLLELNSGGKSAARSYSNRKRAPSFSSVIPPLLILLVPHGSVVAGSQAAIHLARG
jgi:hypothetical protein